MPDETFGAIAGRLPDSFSRDLLVDALRVLACDKLKFSFHLFCAGHRELIAHFLDVHAPKERVAECDWCTPLEDGRISRRDRIRFALIGGLSKKQADGHLIDLEHDVNILLKSMDELSKQTHLRPGRVVDDKDKKQQLATELLESTAQFLAQFFNQRKRVLEQASDLLEKELFVSAIENHSDELGEIASHYSVEEVAIDQHAVISIGAKEMHVEVSGEIFVVLQYGSSGDVRRGIGHVKSDKYPFTGRFAISTSKYPNFDVLKTEYTVNNSSFYD